MPFSEKKARHAIEFIETLCSHTKGRWAGQRFTLLEWQRKAIVELFGRVKDDGYRQYRTCYTEIPKKNGKALAVDTPVPTIDGWVAMGDLVPGERVFDDAGRVCNVVAVSEIMYGRPCFEVCFSDKTTIVADIDHLWETQTYSPWYKTAIRTTGQILETLDYQAGSNHRIRLAAPLELPRREFPVHPYVLGVWLGDGNQYNSSVTCPYGDGEILEKISGFGESVREWKTNSQTCGQFAVGCRGRSQAERNESCQARLRHLGVLQNKHIPKTYLRGAVDQRMDLLRGLMDTDGYVSRAGQCEFSSSNKKLAQNFIELTRSLGFKPTVKTTTAMFNGKSYGTAYRIQFWAYADNPVFYLQRKKNRQKQAPDKPTRTSFRKIKAVKAVPSVPVRCIQVDSTSSLFLAGEGMVPTHNSELGAAVALLMTCGDGEIGGEVYSAAADKEQAGLVYAVAAQMVRQNAVLSNRLKIIDSKKRIVDYKSNTFYQVLSRETFSKHGINPSAIIFDELHAQPTRELWDVLVEGTDYARTQQLVMALTTAGVYDVNSICWEVREHARQVKDGLIEDDSILPVMYVADKEKDDYADPEVWARVNPSIGHIFTMEKIREDFEKVQSNPARLNNFLRFRLNMWVNQSTRWLPMDKWDACSKPVNKGDLLKQTCYGGLDLSSTTDLSAFVLVFPPSEWSDCWQVVCKFYVPEDTIMKRSKEDRVSYNRWRDQGFITATPGEVVDYDFIRRDVNQAANLYDLREVAYDPWGAVKLSQDLDGKDGITMVEHRQGYRSMSPPTKELYKLITSGALAHGGNPVLRWCADNMVVEMDAAENVKPAKNKARERIDGIVALIMAISRGIFHVENEGKGNDGSLLLIG